MFDLKAGVHLHEEELVGCVSRDDELHGAGATVTHTASRLAGGLADARARRLIQQYRGSLFDHLLMSALQGAFALAEVHCCAGVVGEHLHLDVARAGDESFDEDRAVSE